MVSLCRAGCDVTKQSKHDADLAAYRELIAAKSRYDYAAGFDCNAQWPHLFQFQSDIVRWGLRRGRAAFFEDTGLGKTRQQVTIGNEVLAHVGNESSFLIAAPLVVARQTIEEAKTFGVDVRYVRNQDEVRPGISITNYERLDAFDMSRFAGIALDESSILKNGDGKTRNRLIESCQCVPYRAAFTATPAPNDLDELGNHAEWLGVMTLAEMRAMFFTHGGENGETQKWVLKGHARQAFWHWVCQWAVMVRRPSDLGYSDDGYVLPPLDMRNHIIAATAEQAKAQGKLFAEPAKGLTEQRKAKRATLDERIAMAANLANETNEQFIVWCELNPEASAATKLINGAVEVKGNDSPEEKADRLMAFARGDIRVLVTKPKIAAMGMNFQRSHRQIWVGATDSWEKFYQGIRRQQRFGQQNTVRVDVISSELDGIVLGNLQRKQADADKMADEISAVTMQYVRANVKSVSRNVSIYNPTKPMMIPSWLVSQP
ncbi:MAG: helicase [Desulfurellales bacterium]|nr:MAG: helicase [Desulfurellales bacterium]